MVTHAFFKALLFLGSGSVIHGMHDEQDMRRMGALRKFMPVTAATFIVGWLAIAGVPPFAGFWSKDEILLFALASNPALYVVGLVTAVLTAYYMTRQVVMVFFGEAKWESHAAEHGAHGEFKPHESSPVMLFPLVVLAGLAIVGGVIQLPAFAGSPTTSRTSSSTGCTPSSSSARPRSSATSAYDNKGLLALVAIAASLIGIAAGIAVYAEAQGQGDRAADPRRRVDRYDAHGERVHGRSRAQGLRGDRLVRPDRRRRRRQRVGSCRARSRAPDSARARPATCATTPASSGSASCCCSPGSCSPGESCDGRESHEQLRRRSRS